MAKWIKTPEHKLDAAIDKLLVELETYDPETEEYKNAMKHLDMLYKMKSGDRRSPISMDSLVSAGVYILGIVIVVSYEHKHVITSKAMGMVPKPR